MSNDALFSSRNTAILIDNKLYILGGYDSNVNPVGKEFFYLNLSVTFNTQNLLWNDLSSININFVKGNKVILYILLLYKIIMKS